MTTGEYLAALDAAADAGAREAIFASCAAEQREALRAALTYRRFVAEGHEQIAAQRAAFEAFEAELDAAPDEAARLKIISAAAIDPQRGSSWLAEWNWQRRATVHDWHARYFSLFGKAT